MRLTTSSGGGGGGGGRVLTWLLLNDPILYVVLSHVTRTRCCFYANLEGDKFRDVYQIFKLRFEQK